MDPSTLAPAAIVQAIAVWVLQWLKKSNWFPWLNQNSATANRVVAFAIALLSAAGITWHYNVTLGTLTVMGLTEQAIWTALAGFVTNELVYMGVQIKAASVLAPPAPVPKS